MFLNSEKAGVYVGNHARAVLNRIKMGYAPLCMQLGRLGACFGSNSRMERLCSHQGYNFFVFLIYAR